MPPFTATITKAFFLFPVTQRCHNAEDCVKLTANNDGRDKWVEKVFGRGAKTAKSLKQKRSHKPNFIRQTFESLMHHHKKAGSGNKSAYDEQSYKEELEMYIAESSATLRYDEGPLDNSDDETSEEEFDSGLISPRNAEIFDVSALIVSDKTEEFVVPPVEVPCKYRRQDRKGGVLVAGRYVLFTNYAFKRQMHCMGRLGPLPELAEARLHVGPYSEKIVEL